MQKKIYENYTKENRKVIMRVNIIHPIPVSFLDYPDKESLCLSVYMMGCSNNCIRCHNKEFQDYDYDVGTALLGPLDLFYVLKDASERNFNTKKVCLLGGDPLSGNNVFFTIEFLKINEVMWGRYFDICLYTGCTYTEVPEIIKQRCEFIKTGKYSHKNRLKPEKTNKYIQFGSSNQKLYNKNGSILTEKGRYYFD